ncbi:hypothetical protein BX616_001236 [Lobosporangium transversale]|nr:hypothetical protein BX616_001236 [Lobosporangium transversale]
MGELSGKADAEAVRVEDDGGKSAGICTRRGGIESGMVTVSPTAAGVVAPACPRAAVPSEGEVMADASGGAGDMSEKTTRQEHVENGDDTMIKMKNRDPKENAKVLRM